MLQIVFKPMPCVTAKDTTILRKARAEFVTTAAISCDSTVWADGAGRTWLEAEGIDSMRRAKEIDRMADKRYNLPDDLVWQFENEEEGRKAADIATGDDIYG